MPHDADSAVGRRTILAGATASAALLWSARGAIAAIPPIADTACGKVSGLRAGGVAIFKGIPYGASTAGANRFMPPTKPEPWTGVRDATMLGDRCPQTPSNVLPEEASLADNSPMSEDCLRLNVWTANGSGGDLLFDGTNLAARHDVVVVTINHRLNLFGFLYLGSAGGAEFADSGNVGMLDCVAALEWVRDNIANFGGDPGNVTVFGQSGGAGKVTTLMAMPAAQGLFHRAIAQSGQDVRRGSIEDAAKATSLVLDALGVAPGDVARLQEIPAAQLLAAAKALKAPLRPVVDGRSLPTAPFDPSAPEISANVPLLIGSTLTETAYMADTPLDPVDDATLQQKVKQFTKLSDADAASLIAVYRRTRPGADTALLYQLISTDFTFTYSVVAKAEMKAKLGAAPAYVYHFEKPTPVRGGKLNVPHTLDIAYIFDNLDLAAAVVGPPENGRALADRMSRAWTAFARTGTPNVSGLPHWPAYAPDWRSVMILADRCAVVDDPNAAERLAVAGFKA
jgi:para-nitrobenzyl esterase